MSNRLVTDLENFYKSINSTNIVNARINKSPVYEQISDETLNNQSKKALTDLVRHDTNSLNLRNRQLTSILVNFNDYYFKNSNQNLKLKKRMFKWFMFFLLAIIVLIPVCLITLTALKLISGTVMIVTYISSAASLVTSIIVIPGVIAEYLFSRDEDKVVAKLIKNIQVSDEHIRSLHNEKNNNFNKESSQSKE